MSGRPGPEIDRFLAKVSLSDGCWEWRGAHAQNGYAHLWRKATRSVATAHRIAYELFVGPIPEGFQIDHLCRNRGCVNPAHLEAVTQQENIRRGALVRTHCKHGHEFTAENTRMEGGGRRCLTCKRAKDSARRLRAARAVLACPPQQRGEK